MINQPIFILGSGRSGTTILYNLLSVHPQLCWFSILTDKHYVWPQLSALHRMLDIPWIGQKLKHRVSVSDKNTYSLYPVEGEGIYHALCHFEQDKKTTDRSPGTARRELLKQRIETHLKYTGKPRFINKQTANTQRIALMHALFPDAYWIHIIRDGRAVANSLSHVAWWPTTRLWWLGKTPLEWNPDGTKWLALSAKHWQKNVTEIRSHTSRLKPKYLEIRYEDLVRNPREVISRIIRFTHLTTEESYLETLPASLNDSNIKWRSSLSEKSKKLLNKTIGPYLRSLGYRT